jgi:hypothetical protein
VIYNVQLMIDCHDPDAISRFWGRALQYKNEFAFMTPEQQREWRLDYPQYDGHGRIDDDAGRRMAIYLEAVPEPKTTRNRLRPEIAVRSKAVADTVSALHGLGATGDAGAMRDVEGNEFTVVGGLTAGDAERRMQSIVLDCLDPDRMLEFWSQALMYTPSDGRCDPPPGWRHIEDGWLFAHGERISPVERALFWGGEIPAPDRELFDLTPGMAFVKTDEPKRIKNRMHIDFQTRDPEGNRDRLVALGATVVRWDDQHVLRDPEGNELCAG